MLKTTGIKKGALKKGNAAKKSNLKESTKAARSKEKQFGMSTSVRKFLPPNLEYENSDSSTSVLTENLSVWRRAAKEHAKLCKEKYSKELGREVDLHRNDSDTMILLKERITPVYLQMAEKERTAEKQSQETKKIKKSKSALFDEWISMKYIKNLLQNDKIKEGQVQELREAVQEIKDNMGRSTKLNNWRENREYIEKEKKVREKLRSQMQNTKCNNDGAKATESNESLDDDWVKIIKAAEEKQRIEPLELGKLQGQGMKDPGPYLTKYIVKPDPAFRARYKHILENEASRPSEIYLDGDHTGDKFPDPAVLQTSILNLLEQGDLKHI